MPPKKAPTVGISAPKTHTPIASTDPRDNPGSCSGKCGGACGGKKSGGTCGTGGGCCTSTMGTIRCPFFILLLALILGTSLLGLGHFIGKGISAISTAQQTITVRGLAERAVAADLAIWNIGFVATGNDVAEVQTKIDSDAEKIRAFLLAHDITADEIIEQPTTMTDLLSRDYRPEGANQSRYIVTAGLRVRSNKVTVVRDLSGAKIGDLIKQGVTLREGQPPVFVFTKLTAIKPDMVAEATQDARRAADQFAKDSGAELGRMKAAQQGVFQILPRDQASGVVEDYEINKTIRVVTTVDYFLGE